jgi:hypothetical protein
MLMVHPLVLGTGRRLFADGGGSAERENRIRKRAFVLSAPVAEAVVSHFPLRRARCANSEADGSTSSWARSC